MTRKQRHVFWSFLFGGGLLGIGLLIGQVGSADFVALDPAAETGYLSIIPAPSSPVSSTATPPATRGVLVYNQSKTIGQLVAINWESNQRQVIFTDADETL